MRTHRLHQKFRAQLFLSSWITLLTCPTLLSWQQEHRQRKGIYTWNWSWKESEKQTDFLPKCRAWHFPSPNSSPALDRNEQGIKERWSTQALQPFPDPPIPSPCWDLLPLCQVKLSWLWTGGNWSHPKYSRDNKINWYNYYPDIITPASQIFPQRDKGGSRLSLSAVEAQGGTGAAHSVLHPSICCPVTPAQELSAQVRAFLSLFFFFFIIFFFLFICYISVISVCCSGVLWQGRIQRKDQKWFWQLWAQVIPQERKSAHFRSRGAQQGKNREVLDQDWG